MNSFSPNPGSQGTSGEVRELYPLAVIGPTGSGKTDLALDCAEATAGEIINIDSMQLYDGMDIGTAKIPMEDRRGIPHHLLDIWDVRHTASVAEYKRLSQEKIEDLLERGIRPIIVGGSMLYIQSLLDDWQFPPTDPDVRAKYESLRQKIGTQELHRYLASIDPKAAEIIEPLDPRRTVRALEVIELTGEPFAASQPSISQTPAWGTRIVSLQAPAQWLNTRLEQRVEHMFERGLINEVEHLQGRGLIAESTAGRAIGYAQVLDYLSGEITRDQAQELTFIATRKYARRQRAWFKRDPRAYKVDAEQLAQLSSSDRHAWLAEIIAL